MDAWSSSGVAGWDDTALDDALRANELELRALHARRAQILAATTARGSHRNNGHRTVPSYLRATCNSGTGTAKKDHVLAKLVGAHPLVAVALETGRVSVDHAHEIARVHLNPRITRMLEAILDPLLEMAEHLSLGEFGIRVGSIIGLADQDGAFRDLERSVDGRRAWVDDMAGVLHLTASGGDPLTAAQMTAVFESFTAAELQADVAARRAEFGDNADVHSLPRTPSQRSFDALVAIFTAAAGSAAAGSAAAGSGGVGGLPEPTVNVVIDQATLHDALTHAGLTLPSGNQIDIDGDGQVDEVGLLADLTKRIVEDPVGLLGRECRLASGAAVHPSVVLRALLTGHVRRVVVDSAKVVTEFGKRQRVFAGAARDAALLLSIYCSHPGCEVRARYGQVDHMIEWSTGGETSQVNAQPRCGPHNRFKHRNNWRSRRDEAGRTYDIRPDDVIVLPVGERPPDLTHHELGELARARLRALSS